MRPGNLSMALSEPVIDVFKTNVPDKASANYVLRTLQQAIPSAVINFDLEDCDKILRIKFDKSYRDPFMIIQTVTELGFEIQMLE